MFVIPKPGFKIRDPITKRHIPQEGAFVPDNTYWRRLLAAGDVALSDDDVVPLKVSDLSYVEYDAKKEKA